MINFALFILATIGLTNIVVHGSIMDILGIRPFLKKNLSEEVYSMFECYQCTGFWCGLIMGTVVISVHPLLILACGFAGSLVSQFYSDLVYLMRSKTDFVIEDEDEQQT